MLTFDLYAHTHAHAYTYVKTKAKASRIVRGLQSTAPWNKMGSLFKELRGRELLR